VGKKFGGGLRYGPVPFARQYCHSLKLGLLHVGIPLPAPNRGTERNRRSIRRLRLEKPE